MSTQTSSVWEVMRSQFILDHQVNRPEVQRQLKWLAAHPQYISQLSQSRPYIYHIVTEIKKRKMPGEIALLPLIESAFDPFSYSKVGAAGLWQIMPHTGKELGLKKDWWTDNRRSIAPSTRAALNYLGYLNHFFNGNWDLTFAAYDAGEGTVLRAIKRAGQNQKQGNYWTIALPHETRMYVPRLLALAEVIAHPERYNAHLPLIPHKPYFEEVKINNPIDLNHAAKLAGMSYNELIKLNPGFNRWTASPNEPFKLLIPKTNVDQFYQNLAISTRRLERQLTYHYVQAGDTIKSISKRYYTTANLIRTLNQLSDEELKPGQKLLIPIEQLYIEHQHPISQPLPQLPELIKVVHIVQENEYLDDIAKKYKTSPEMILEWNHLTQQAFLKKNQQLIIWKKP